MYVRRHAKPARFLKEGDECEYGDFIIFRGAKFFRKVDVLHGAKMTKDLP